VPGENTICQYLGVFARVAAHFVCGICFIGPLSAQPPGCPPNIDFESGTFDNWNCYIGSVAAVNGQNVMTLNPVTGAVFNRQTMIANQGSDVDYYGGFPVSCPNGSGYSIRLGNDEAGTQAEGISYEFTIPANMPVYSLIYHYAVVFQDPHHLDFQQPRLELEITNVTDNELITCSSFTFYPIGTLLPGFFLSPIQKDSVDVWCKDWSAVSINLNGQAGKTIRLFFKTADCTFRRHFGYAYIDVNSECNSEFVGATFCPDDSTVNVTGPYGYENYTWFNNSFTQVLGSQQTINFTPPPPVGTTIAVEVTPFNGYGCPDTLYAQLVDTLTVVSRAGKDTLSCNRKPVQIGANPVPGLSYSWSPPSYLSSPVIANPRASPPVNTVYVLTTRSAGGGCADRDTVIVRSSTVDSTITLTGKASFCITSNDSAVLSVNPGRQIQWFRGSQLIGGATDPSIRVTQSGDYYALITNNEGCQSTTDEIIISIEEPIPGIRYPTEYAVINYPIQLQARNIGVEAEWSPPLYLNDATSYAPRFNGPVDFTYTVSLKTNAGCVTVDTQLVKTFKEVKFYVPTAFTPNHDGLNDFIRPIPAGIKNILYFRIYNRWGQLVFDLKNDPRGWDGTIGGKLQGSGVYAWIVEGVGLNDLVYKQKGTVTLIR